MKFDKKVLIVFLIIASLLWIVHIVTELILSQYMIEYKSIFFQIATFAILSISGLIVSFFYFKSKKEYSLKDNLIEKFKTIAENIDDIIILYDFNGKITYSNKIAENILKVDDSNAVINNINKFVHPDNIEDIMISNNSIKKDLNKIINLNLKFINSENNGDIYDVKLKKIGEKQILFIAKNITDSVNQIHQIEHMNNVLTGIKSINRLISTEKNTKQLLKKIVEELLRDKRYAKGWIILLDDDLTVKEYADANMGNKFNEFIEYIRSYGLPNHIQNAIEQRKLIVIKEESEACINCPLYHQEVFGKSMIMPLVFKDKIFGVISATIPEISIISDKEYNLFEELGNDLSFSIYSVFVENERIEAQKRYQLQFEFAMDAILLADAETGTIVDCNKACEKLFNTEKKNLIGLHQTQLHPVDGHDYKKDFEEHQGEYTEKTIDSKIITKDNQIKNVTIKASLIRFYDKLYKQGIFRDTSEKIALSNELNQIFELSLDLICTARISDAKFLKVNPAFEKYLGYSNEELINHSFFDFIHEDDIESTKAVVADQLKQGRSVFNFENRYRTKKGEYIWLEWQSNPIKEFDILYAIAHNITERKKRENELIRTKRLIELEKSYKDSILSVLPDMLFITNINGFITNYHANDDKYFILQPEAFINRSIHDVLPYHLAKLTQEKMDIVLKTDQLQIYTFKLEINNEEHSFEGRMIKFSETEVLVIVRNISELVKYQNELIKAKEKAEENDKLKSAFLANLSHEIRTPINGIMGFAQIMNEETFDPDVYKNYSDIIYSSANHLLNIINDIIDISKIESGQMQLYNIIFDLNQVLDDLLSLFNSLTVKTQKNISIELFKDVDNTFMIEADDTKIRQIFNNLLSNSLKFTEEGSIKFGYKLQDDNKLLFFVKDTGIGIPEDQHKYVFERFRQARRKDKKLYRGTGLGLSISKECVKMLNGDIWFNSEVNKGTDFYFTIEYKRISDSNSISDKK